MPRRKIGGNDFYETYVPEPMAYESVFSSWSRADYTPDYPEAYDQRVRPLLLEAAKRQAAHQGMRERLAQEHAVPTFEQARAALPQPSWAGHDSVIACYWRVWEIAFSNIRRKSAENEFVSDFAATMFNDCTFMWDSAFIALFGRYASRAWDFQQTLDNFYAKQHPDGFICRQIRESDGTDCFTRFDPGATGPNVLPWSEWEYFLNTGDRVRLAAVFPPLVAYSRWCRRYRTWPSGLYWNTGWGCGMDNQPRLPPDVHHAFEHGGQTWVDATMQQLMVAKLLLAMARELGRGDDVADFAREAEQLEDVAGKALWDEGTGFFHDLRPDQSRITEIKTVGAFWALLAEAVRADRLERLLAHLEDPREFNRPHRVPSLAASHPLYEAQGGYWKGAVWAPTNYMVLRGLSRFGRDELAHAIALNHIANVVAAFERTGTLWENYAPEVVGQGNNGKDFVGWTGLPPVAVLFEYAFGLRPDVPTRRIVWDVRLLEEHGVERYPFGTTGLLELRCPARATREDKPQVSVRSNVAFELDLRWAGGRELCHIEATL